MCHENSEIKKVKKIKQHSQPIPETINLLGSAPVLGCPKSKLWFELRRLLTSSLGPDVQQAFLAQTQRVAGMGRGQCRWRSPV